MQRDLDTMNDDSWRSAIVEAILDLLRSNTNVSRDMIVAWLKTNHDNRHSKYLRARYRTAIECLTRGEHCHQAPEQTG